MVIKALASLTSLLIALNFWGWQQSFWGIILGAIWILLTSWLLGGCSGQLAINKSTRLIWGTIILCCGVSLAGSILFYVNLFSQTALFALAFILPWLGKHTIIRQTTPDASKKNLTQIIIDWLIVSSYLSAIIIFYLLVNFLKTAEAIRTPWLVVPPALFILLGLIAVLVIIVANKKTSPLWLVPFYFIFLSLLPNIFPLGYGFDPFIHQASEKLLSLTGTISPKPLYYLGQYSLVNFFAQIFYLPIKFTDIWLLPALTSLTLPIVIYNFLNQLKTPASWKNVLCLAPLLLAVTYFTYTTPQGLAYLMLLIATFILASQKIGLTIPLWLPWLMAGATFFTHPLAGLPLIGVIAWWWLDNFGLNFKKIKYYKLGMQIFTALIIPLTFIVSSWLKPSAANVKLTSHLGDNLAKLLQEINYHLPFWPRFIDLPDLVYLWGRPLVFLAVLLAIIGFIRSRYSFQPLSTLAHITLMPLVGFLIMTLLFYFPNLPANEQNFYSVRLWEITLLLMWPMVLVGLAWLLMKINDQIKYPLFLIGAGSLLLVTSYYLTYQRLDIWHRDTAYNTTPYDINAVRLISQQSGGADYVVLANQAVSAAAIDEFGFNKYYQGNFYYPVPTGVNPLYEIYLNAVEQGTPTRDIIAPAANLGVSQVFLVLNRYWANYYTLSEIAQKQADAWWSIADGKVTVYRYDF